MPHVLRRAACRSSPRAFCLPEVPLHRQAGHGQAQVPMVFRLRPGCLQVAQKACPNLGTGLAHDAAQEEELPALTPVDTRAGELLLDEAQGFPAPAALDLVGHSGECPSVQPFHWAQAKAGCKGVAGQGVPFVPLCFGLDEALPRIDGTGEGELEEAAEVGPLTCGSAGLPEAHDSRPGRPEPEGPYLEAHEHAQAVQKTGPQAQGLLETASRLVLVRQGKRLPCPGEPGEEVLGGQPRCLAEGIEGLPSPSQLGQGASPLHVHPGVPWVEGAGRLQISHGLGHSTALAMGKAAVTLALEGKSGVMPTVVRTSDKPYKWKVGEARLSRVANKEKMMPRKFITKDGFGITAAARRYLEPLIHGEDYPPYDKHGLPRYVRLKRVLVPKKLDPFET